MVAEALKSLPRVDAPGDFEMRVKARIAEGKSDSKPRILGLPRFALAFTALVVVVAGVALFFTVRKGADEVAVTSDIERSVPPIASDAPAAPLVNGSSNRADVARAESNSLTNTDGGVREEAAKQAETIDLGINSKQPVARQQGSSIGAGEMLSGLGADVSFEGGGWTVRKISSGSRAAATGFKPGDTVLAVDGITLSLETRLSSPFEGKVFLVRRPGTDKLVALLAAR